MNTNTINAQSIMNAILNHAPALMQHPAATKLVELLTSDASVDDIMATLQDLRIKITAHDPAHHAVNRVISIIQLAQRQAQGNATMNQPQNNSGTAMHEQILQVIEGQMPLLLTDDSTRSLLHLLRQFATGNTIRAEIDRICYAGDTAPFVVNELRRLTNFINNLELSNNIANSPTYNQADTLFQQMRAVAQPHPLFAQPMVQPQPNMGMNVGISLLQSVPNFPMPTNVDTERLLDLLKRVSQVVDQAPSHAVGLSPATAIQHELAMVVGQTYMGQYFNGVRLLFGYLLMVNRSLDENDRTPYPIRRGDDALHLAETVIRFLEKFGITMRQFHQNLNTALLRREQTIPLRVTGQDHCVIVQPQTAIQAKRLIELCHDHGTIKNGKCTTEELITELPKCQYSEIHFIWESLEEVPFRELGFMVEFL